MTFSASFFDYPGSGPAEEASQGFFLQDATDVDWATLAEFTERRRFRAGAEVIRRGDRERALDIVTSGSLEVLLAQSRAGARRIAVIDAGSVIGEVAFFDGRPRTATVRAISDGEIAHLSFEAFELLAARAPALARAILLDLGKILASRLRESDRLLSG